MKKKIKYLLVVFAFVAVLFLVPKAYAASISTNSTSGPSGSYMIDNTGTITVTGVGTDTFKAYKIVDYFYKSADNEIVYAFTSDFYDFALDYDPNFTISDYMTLTSGSNNGSTQQSTSTLDTLISNYVGYISSNSVQGSDLTTTSGSASATLPVGAYLVLPVNTSKMYAVMVGNIDMEVTGNGEGTVTNASIVAKVSAGGVTKAVTEGAYGSEGENYAPLNTNFKNVITVTKPQIPTNATNHTFTVSDIASGAGIELVSTISQIVVKDGNLTLNFDSVDSTNGTAELYNEGAKVGDLTYQVNPASVTIAFNGEEIVNNTITIEYNTKLNNSANIGGQGNTSTTSLFLGNPYGTSGNSFATASSSVETIILSYGVKVTTKDKNGKSLTGAEYEIANDENFENTLRSLTTSGSESSITGLTSGSYYIRQVTAPAGGTVDSTPRSITIPTQQSGYYEVEYVDSTVGLLPLTGGPGTIALFAAGILLIVGAFAYFKIQSKKKAKNVAQ